MVNGIGNTSRNRRQRPLSDDLPEQTRVLLRELRVLRERAGLDLRALEQATHASRSSWGRWLSGETWIPLDAVEGLARLCGEDPGGLRRMWEAAERDRRAAGVPATGVPETEDPTRETTGKGAGTGVTVPERGEPVPEPGVTLLDHGMTVPDLGADVRDLDVTEPGRDLTVSRPPAGRPRRRFLIGTAVGLFLGTAAGLAIGGSVLMNGEGEKAGPTGTTVDRARATTGAKAKAIDRDTVIERAESWHPGTERRIPYSQTRNHDGYRTDGSGYASMALGLRKPGPNTISLVSAAFSRPIGMRELLRGDLVIDPVGGSTARAVVVFDRWADSGRTSYWAYQQRAQYGTDHRVVRHGLRPGDDFRAYRPVNIREGAPGRDTASPE
ncbi:helix-turn-helix domain-containing protein [Streptosporangium sp. DT93]|uniref:helix-turn-helix domain-containing protein n=1 Tax=Streptosporangium sp. DT93 TaxID=3393428 RepID=UPI003CF7A03C